MSLHDTLGTAFIAALVFSPCPLGFVASWKLSKRSVEEWQLLAWIPPIPLAVWWVYLLISTLRDPSSHNLWPLEYVFWTAVSGALFVVLLIARKIFMPPNEPKPPFHR